MAQSFDIRFDRTAGLASFFAAAENSFQWKGVGRLSIDAQGISIAARRGLTSLFLRPSSHRIAAADLKEVYREGTSLRMEFQAENQSRAVLPFWVSDRESAEEIVRLMPTTRTVELEQDPSSPQSGRHRWDHAAVLMAGLMVAAALAAGWYFTNRSGHPDAGPIASTVMPAPQTRAPVAGSAVAEPESPAEPAKPAAITIEPQIVSIPVELPDLPQAPLPATVADADRLDLAIKPGTAAYLASQRYVAAFEQQARVIDAEYRASRQLMNGAAISPEDFAARLDELEMRWWNITFQLLDDNELSGPEMLDLRAAMLGIARHWRNFLSGYSTGLSKRDHVMIAHSFDSLTRAEEMRARVRTLLR